MIKTQHHPSFLSNSVQRLAVEAEGGRHQQKASVAVWLGVEAQVGNEWVYSYI